MQIDMLRFYYQGLKTIPAQLATLAELSFHVFAAVINCVFLDMGLTSYQIIGGMMLILVNIGLRVKKSKKNDLSPVVQQKLRHTSYLQHKKLV